ncbi:insecticidal delta-endotoxin Cry8Ea1 family protein [Bacillus thuringiensis]|uniref:insecticidal delta-endotoxin Cry8Ea1 family protein n=1 Tax=Bacillus thuringiensis TaxID=1428 RepID=UPI0029617B3F|nr:hypothetical protein [Bacillus cereus]
MRENIKNYPYSRALQYPLLLNTPYRAVPYPNIYPKLYPSKNSNIIPTKLDNIYSRSQEMCTTSSSNISREFMITAAGIVWALGGFIPGVGNIIAAVPGGLVNVLLPVFWEADTSDQTSKLMCDMEILINQKINEYAFNTALAYLEGLTRLLMVYNQTIKDWRESQGNTGFQKAAEDVREMFREVHSHFIVAMPMFKIYGSEIHLLPIYARAATTHLTILRDIVKFGSQYGFDEKTMNSFYEYLKQSIAEYTNHCINTYTQGLESTKKQKADLTDIKRYPWVRGNRDNFQGIENWNLFNAYRRDMTLLVLDLVATWPTLDPKVYTTELTQTQLARELYSDIRGSDTLGVSTSYNSIITLDNIENNCIRKPGLFTWLDNIEMYYNMYTLWAPLGTGPDFNRLSGIKQKISYTCSDVQEEYLLGVLGSPVCSVKKSRIIETKVDIDVISTQLNITSIEFLDQNKDSISNCKISSSFEYGTFTFSNQIPEGKFNSTYSEAIGNFVPSHNLSRICAGKSTPQGLSSDDRFINYIGFSWTHPSINPKNILSPNYITQIPAVTSQKLFGNTKVIKGSGITGGDLVQLSPKSPMILSVTAPVGFTNYTMRVRCANQQAGSLIIRSNDKDGNQTTTTFSIPQNKHYTADLLYESYQTVTADSNIQLESSPKEEMKYDLYIYSEDMEMIILDKVEFIPQKFNKYK